MSKVVQFVQEYPDRAQDGVCPPSPNSSRGSAGYQERILQLNREFQVGPLIFDRSRSSATPESGAGSEAAPGGEAVENSIVGPFLPPDNPGPNTVSGGMDPFTTLVEMGGVEFMEPTRFYKMNFDPSRLRLAYGGGGVQLLVEVDPDNDLEVESIPSVRNGVRAVGIQVQPRSSEKGAQYDASDVAGSDDDEPSSASTVPPDVAHMEHVEFVASRELTK